MVSLEGMKSKMEGVIIKERERHTDERGFFSEIFRFAEEFKNLKVGQLSHSLVKEGVIKGWHGHKEQSQWNYVVTGKARVVLYDNRYKSASYQMSQEFRIGDDVKPQAYFFSPGILHGYKCLEKMHIIYVTSEVYNPEEEVKIMMSHPEVKNCIW